ncbi:MAG: hypothetical protein KC591_14345, partial [Gemmatimonadetes bacterium]|nr:hypothetical protein [Gemmatimonadota bacterium]
MNEVTSADRELFAEFARRIEAALKDRIEGEVAAGELSDFAFGAEELASLAQEGAALLPARWPSEGGD